MSAHHAVGDINAIQSLYLAFCTLIMLPLIPQKDSLSLQSKSAPRRPQKAGATDIERLLTRLANK
jgi:hypothetical protein